MRFLKQKNSILSSLPVPPRLICAAAFVFGAAMSLSRAGTAQNAPAQNAPAPNVSAPNVSAPGFNSKLPTVWVVGDSTARNNAGGAQGWGDPFAAYFDTSKINVPNRAMAGRSSRTFTTDGRWDTIMKDLKAGDFVLLQMGHNDGGSIDTGRARASMPGLGEESREITKADGTKEVVYTYGHYMRRFIADTKAKGATPIVLSLTVRNIWKDGQVERGSGSYRALTQELAKSQGVEWLDLTSIVADKYNQIGLEATKAMFGPDYVHTSPLGAGVNAAAVVAGLKTLKNTGLLPFLSEKGRAVAPYVPVQTPPLVPVTNVAPTVTFGGAAPVPATAIATATVPAPATATVPVAVDANVARPATTRRPLPVPADPALPTLFFIGDSTVRNGQGDGGGGQWGWGEPIAAYFDQNKINVVNRAVGGLSSRTYLTGGFWSDTLAMIKPGDFVIMQFGHNDASALNDDSRARGTIRSSGEETEEIDNLLTKKHETVHSYGWYLRRFIADARAKGATSMVCSPIPRKGFTNGKASRSSNSFGKWAQESAQMTGTAFIPLNEIIAAKYDVLGPEKVEPLFADANTHTSMAGAEINAQSVIEGLKALLINPLSAYFSVKAATLAKAQIAPLIAAPANVPLP